MKKCVICKKNKELTEFTRKKLNIDGYCNVCKKCEEKRKVNFIERYRKKNQLLINEIKEM